MKIRRTIGLAAVATIALAGTVLAAASVNLGTATSFAVLAGTTITNTGATTIRGDVGLQPGTAVTGFTTVTLSGAQHLADAVALQAKTDLVTAYNDAAGATPASQVPTELGGTTLKPGVYASATLGLTGTLTLDGAGVYIFQSASTLITASNSAVALINGASACDVFWQVGSSATLGTTTSFKGTILALTSIALNDGVTLQGRALARNGEVTMIHDTIDSASCAAPSPTAKPSTSPTAKPSTSPSAQPSTSPTAQASASTAAAGITQPPTDSVGTTPAAVTEPVPMALLMLLVVASIGWVWSIRYVAMRSRRRG